MARSQENPYEVVEIEVLGEVAQTTDAFGAQDTAPSAGVSIEQLSTKTTAAEDVALSPEGAIRVGARTYGEFGIWGGKDGSTFKFSIVGTSSSFLTFDGTNLNISGSFSASTIDIGGSDATSFHVDIDGNMWLGAGTFASAPAKISNAGAATLTSVVLTGLQAGSSIDGQYLLSASVTGSAIASATITGSNIASATITATNIVNATITTTQIASATITGSNIASGTITSTNIQDATIVGGDIASGTITATNITAGTITATEIANATITGSKIASGTITSTNILDGTITGSDIASATITGSNIASTTITATNITALTITAAEIANLTINGAKIASGSITPIKTTMPLFMVSGGTFSDDTPDTNSVSWTSVTIQYNGTEYAITNSSTSSRYIVWDSTSPTTISGSSTVPTVATTWLIGMNNTGTFLKTWDMPQVHGEQIQSATITGTQIASATITATNITAATITATQIASGTITGTNIASGTITSANIQDATIVGGDIASATITAANIANATITTTQISGSAGITGSQIASTTISAANIANATITTTQISGSAGITGSQIANTTIAAANIVNATITTTQIASATITGSNIASGTITATNISALTITAAEIANLTISTGKIADLAITNAKINDLAVSKLTAGTITSQSINLAVTDTAGDVEIRSGIATGDFANSGAASGFILGVDDSDSNLAKFYVGNSTKYAKWDGSNWIVNGVAMDATSTINSSTALNVQSRAESIFKDDFIFIGADNDGLTTSAPSFGTLARNLSTTIITTATNNDGGFIRSAVLGRTLDNTNFDWADFTTWEWSGTVQLSATTNQDAAWGLRRVGTVMAANATDVNRHIVFYVEDGTIYASNGNGTTQTKTDITASVTMTNMTFYRFVYTVGTNIKFYVDDTLVATHTTNLPTGASGEEPAFLFQLDARAGATKTILFKNSYLIRATL